MDVFPSVMSKLVPKQSQVEYEPEEPQLAKIGESADGVISVLQSKTARNLLTALYDEPMVPSDLADALDTSVQNIGYHLDNLHQVGLVEVVDTWYSAKGGTMDVYAPTTETLVIVAGEAESISDKFDEL